jgi:uncharacterized OsmC-like protein
MSPARSLSDVIEITKSKVNGNPERAQVVIRSRHHLGGPPPCEVASQVGSGHRFTVDEPAGLGGANAGPSPVELALAALGSCQAITYRFWAAHLGLALDSVDVEVEGDLDVRGFFGIDGGVEGAVRPGYRTVRIRVVVAGPESPQRYQELAAAVDAHCPVLDMFTGTVEVEKTLTVGCRP